MTHFRNGRFSFMKSTREMLQNMPNFFQYFMKIQAVFLFSISCCSIFNLKVSRCFLALALQFDIWNEKKHIFPIKKPILFLAIEQLRL